MAGTVDWHKTEATQQEQLNPVPPYSKFVAIRDFPGETAHDLPFHIGDIITVLEPCNVVFWYLGENNAGRRGVVPINFLKPVNEQKKKHSSIPTRKAVAAPPLPPKAKLSPGHVKSQTSKSLPKAIETPQLSLQVNAPSSSSSLLLSHNFPVTPTYTDIDNRPPAPLPPEALPIQEVCEPMPQAKYSSQLEFTKKSGWFSPTLETVLCKKLGNANLAAFANSAGIYHFHHMDHNGICYTAKSQSAFYDIVQMFHQLYNKPCEKLSPLEFELRYKLPDAKGWMIRLFTVSDPKSIHSEEVWHIVMNRTLQPDGLNKQLTFTSKEQFYEFAERYAKELREKK